MTFRYRLLSKICYRTGGHRWYIYDVGFDDMGWLEVKKRCCLCGDRHSYHSSIRYAIERAKS